MNSPSYNKIKDLLFTADGGISAAFLSFQQKSSLWVGGAFKDRFLNRLYNTSDSTLGTMVTTMSPRLNNGLRQFFPHSGDSLIILGDPTLPVIRPIQGNIKRDLPVLPEQVILYNNYPNPFNSTTTISYGLPNPAKVTLSIYNLRGQKIQALVDKQQNMGWHTILWHGQTDDGKVLGSGMYIYKLETGKKSFTKKMVLVK